MTSLWKVVAWKIECDIFCLKCANEEIQDLGKEVLYGDEMYDVTCCKCGCEIPHYYEVIHEEDPSDEEMGLL